MSNVQNLKDNKKVKVTLSISPESHMKLKLYSVKSGKSNSAVVEEWINKYAVDEDEIVSK